jgi:hypothetical protein
MRRGRAGFEIPGEEARRAGKYSGEAKSGNGGMNRAAEGGPAGNHFPLRPYLGGASCSLAREGTPVTS